MPILPFVVGKGPLQEPSVSGFPDKPSIKFTGVVMLISVSQISKSPLVPELAGVFMITVTSSLLSLSQGGTKDVAK